MSTLDELEQFLRTAEIRDAATFPNQGAHHSFRLTLEGGIAALAKPAATAPGGDAAMVRREVAGYVVARDLGWDLVAPTVLRNVDLPGIGETEASLQMLWPGYQPETPIEQFSEDDTRKAAMFDVIVRHQDRGHN